MSDNLADLPLWSDRECFNILTKLCEKHNVKVEVLEQLVEVMREYQSKERARGINDKFKEILS